MRRYEQAIYDDSDGLVPCSCNGEQHMVLKFMRGWAQKLTPHEHAHTNASSYYTGNFHDHVQTTEAFHRAGDAQSDTVVAGPVLDWAGYKIVELRRNTFDVCMSLLVSLHSGVWHEEALSPSESVDEYVPIEVNATELAHCMWYVEEERNNGQVTHALDERRAAGMLLTLNYEDCVGVGLDVCYSRAVHFITDANATADANPLTADAPMLHAPASDYCPDCDKATCDDAWDFVDSHGLGCDAWAGYDCSDDIAPHCDGRNYTNADMAAIRLACPNSCDVCEEGGGRLSRGRRWRPSTSCSPLQTRTPPSTTRTTCMSTLASTPSPVPTRAPPSAPMAPPPARLSRAPPSPTPRARGSTASAPATCSPLATTGTP